MAKYIEKSVLLEAFTNAEHPIQYPDGSHGLGLGYADFRAILFDLPAADVVEVVRCKDCKWCHAGYCEKYDDLIPFGCANKLWDDWFCADGEKKNG